MRYNEKQMDTMEQLPVQLVTCSGRYRTRYPILATTGNILATTLARYWQDTGKIQATTLARYWQPHWQDTGQILARYSPLHWQDKGNHS